jgi:hypothetical protein
MYADCKIKNGAAMTNQQIVQVFDTKSPSTKKLIAQKLYDAFITKFGGQPIFGLNQELREINKVAAQISDQYKALQESVIKLDHPAWIPCTERMPLQRENFEGYGFYWCFDGKNVALHESNEYPKDDVTPISGFCLGGRYVEGITHWQYVIAPKPPTIKTEGLRP